MISVSDTESDAVPLAESLVGVVLLAFAAYGVYSGEDLLAVGCLSLVALVGCVRSYTRTVEVTHGE